MHDFQGYNYHSLTLYMILKTEILNGVFCWILLNSEMETELSTEEPNEKTDSEAGIQVNDISLYV